MAIKKKPGDQKPQEFNGQQIHFSVKPGTKLQITLDAGKKDLEGKIPLTVSVEPAAEEEEREAEEKAQPADLPIIVETIKVNEQGKIKAGLDALKSRLKAYDLATWLFIFALILYLATRLIGLMKFPIYFFTDEAIQSQSLIDLVKNGYKDSLGTWLPTYFRNGEYYNLSASVYLQWLPYLLFGKSAVVTRATSAFITLIAAVSVGLVLRDIFKIKYWWAGTLFLSVTPAWFLHSRTAFETTEFVAFYAGTLCAYLYYRYKSPRFLYLTISLGALSFYTYSPAQAIMPLTAIALLISDWHYHWENRRTLLIGLGLLLLFTVPYIRASFTNSDLPLAHLHSLWSYWFEDRPLSEKIAHFFSEYGVGLSPWYWYIPNDRDLSRHLMKGYGNIALVTLPFAILGMVYVLRNLRQPACRAILVAMLITPAAAALVQVSITRALVFVVLAAILTTIGLDQLLQWVINPAQRLAELSAGPKPTVRSAALAALILGAGIFVALISKETIDRITFTAIAAPLAIHVSGLLPWLAGPLRRPQIPVMENGWNPSQAILAISTFILLSGANLYMLNDALRNGALWYNDYGMGGMQYGAFQIFDIVKQYAQEHPGTKIIFSPDWANGTDVVARFFLGDPLPIQIGSIRGHLAQKLPLDDNTLFIITPQEYNIAAHDVKFKEVTVERIVPYPDGSPGFYFVRARYADNIDQIFAAEDAPRRVMQESVVTIDGQRVKLRYSYLDTDFQDKSIALVFDNDPYTVAKTYESNPFVIEMTFPAPRTLAGFSIIIGPVPAQITLKCFSEPGVQPVVYVFNGQGTQKQPELSFDLPAPTKVQVLQVEMLNPQAPSDSKTHIWELKLR